MTLLHPRRFVAPPESLADLLRSDHDWHLVRGEVLALLPPGSTALTLPDGLEDDGDADGDNRPRVLAHIDVVEEFRFTRDPPPIVERARAFYIADGRGRALVRVGDDFGRVHPDVDLHLRGPAVERRLPNMPVPVVTFTRTVRVGDPVYVLGRYRLVTHDDAAGLRDAPLLPAFTGELGPLHIYDEPAFRQLAAWYALPWYRKLSLLVRNR